METIASITILVPVLLPLMDKIGVVMFLPNLFYK